MINKDANRWIYTSHGRPMVVTKWVRVPLWPKLFPATGPCKCNKKDNIWVLIDVE